MQQTTYKLLPQSSIVAMGHRYFLAGSLVIGRSHAGCPLDDCKRKGFRRQPDIALPDANGFISKHHASVRVDPQGGCWIEDLHSLNGTAILRQASKTSTVQSTFEVLAPATEYNLVDGDLIALAYNYTRGPYVTISFHA